MNNQLEKKNNDICMICLESTNIYALFNCRCKIYIHNNCLQTWINLHNSCIICRSQLYSFDKDQTIRFKYLCREFNNSQILICFNPMVKYNFRIIKQIKNSVIKWFLFNILNICIIFVFLLPILIYLGIKSQIKYLLDYYANNILYGNAYQLFTINILPV